MSDIKLIKRKTYMSTQSSNNNKRIAKNVKLLYFRQLFMMAVPYIRV